MSTIKSSDEHLTLNADGASKDIKFQANGVEKASISSAGAFTSTTIDATKLTGNLPAVNASALTNLTAANLTGVLPAISGAALTNLPSSDTGKILQTVYVENATDISFPQNTSYTTTVVQASITPASTSSTILCWYSWHGELNGGNYPSLQFAVLRGSTEIQYLNHVGYMGPNSFHRIFPETGFVKDSPNTTSEVTYYLNGGNNSGSSFSGTYGGAANGNGNKSSILLIEVGA